MPGGHRRRRRIGTNARGWAAVVSPGDERRPRRRGASPEGYPFPWGRGPKTPSGTPPARDDVAGFDGRSRGRTPPGRPGPAGVAATEHSSASSHLSPPPDGISRPVAGDLAEHGPGEDARAARDVKATPRVTGRGRRRRDRRAESAGRCRSDRDCIPREDEADLDGEGFCAAANGCPGTRAGTGADLNGGRALELVTITAPHEAGQNAAGGGEHRRGRPPPPSRERMR